jgi:hypothetical protein
MRRYRATYIPTATGTRGAKVLSGWAAVTVRRLKSGTKTSWG